MQSGAVTDVALQRLNEIEFAGALALFFQKRDFALDINWHSRRVRGWLWYYNYLQLIHIEKTLTTDHLMGAFQEGMVRAAKERMAQIMAEAQNEATTTERRRQLLFEASRIQERLQQFMGD